MQDVAIGAMERMANSLQTMVESSRTESEGQKYSTAEGIHHVQIPISSIILIIYKLLTHTRWD